MRSMRAAAKSSRLVPQGTLDGSRTLNEALPGAVAQLAVRPILQIYNNCIIANNYHTE
jgi:hypothetical protein